MHPVQEGAPELWSLVEEVIEECIVAGYLKSELESESTQAENYVKLSVDAT
jgi:hypothetical protein